MKFSGVINLSITSKAMGMAEFTYREGERAE